MRNHHDASFRWRYVTGAVILLAGGGYLMPVHAQTQEPSATLQDQSQRVQQYYQQQMSTPANLQEPLPQAPNTPARPTHIPANVHFVLRKVAFTPSALLPQKALDGAVTPYIGRDVNGNDLSALLARVNALYTERKISTARAVFTRQAVDGGVLHIELVEGKLGAIHIKGLRKTRESFVRKRIDIQPGQVVDTHVLRDNLVYLNATTDLQCKALLEPGAERGQTDILIDVTEPSWHSVDLFMDDNGVDSTGRFRVGVDAKLYGLLGIDDRLEGNFEHSSGANDGEISYSIPVFTDGGRIEASYSRSQINIIDGAFRNLDITGYSDNTSLAYRQPFIATQHWRLSGLVQYSIEDSITNITGQRIADTQTHAASVGGSVLHQSDGESWSVSQLVTHLQSDEPMLGRTDFLISPGSAYYIQRLWQSQWALRADAGWQLSSGKNIPSANLFQIGGLGSVRGYELGVLSGPRGYYTDLELHRNLFDRVDAYVFVDHGTIYSFYPSSKSITGAGPGVLYHFRSWLTLSADVAKSFDTVVPNQGSFRIDARVTIHWE